MYSKIRDIFDFDTFRVAGVALFSTSFSLANINTLINTVVLVGSAIYIWRKVLKPKSKGEKPDEEDTNL